MHTVQSGIRNAVATSGLLLVANTASAQGIDATVDKFFNDYLGWFASLIFTSVPVGGTAFPLIAGWLLVAALIFTLYFGVLQFRKFKLATDIVRGRYSDPNSKDDGEISHFQALATALSGTVGLGNIAGVGAALAIGGPGATFWMIIVGLLGMATKFTECTLGVKYRTVLPSGVVSGGANVLPEPGPCRAWHGWPGQVSRRDVRHHGDSRGAGRRQYVSGQPGQRHAGTDFRFAGRLRLVDGLISGRLCVLGHCWWHAINSFGHLQAGTSHGGALHRHVARRHLVERGQDWTSVLGNP